MALADKIWTPVDIHFVVLTFVRNEWHKIAAHRIARENTDFSLAEDQELIDRPDLSNPAHNHRRLRLLHGWRAQLLVEIPLDTVWYQVAHLQDDDLDQLHVIARCGWDDPDGRDNNTLRQTAQRLPKTLQTAPKDWPPPILWGHGRREPLTIIEGNNRLCAYVNGHATEPLSIPVIIGLSPTPFYFHAFDAPYFLACDLWKS